MSFWEPKVVELATTKIHRLKGRMSPGKGIPETRVIPGRRGPGGMKELGLEVGVVNSHELFSGIS